MKTVVEKLIWKARADVSPLQPWPYDCQTVKLGEIDKPGETDFNAMEREAMRRFPEANWLKHYEDGNTHWFMAGGC